VPRSNPFLVIIELIGRESPPACILVRDHRHAIDPPPARYRQAPGAAESGAPSCGQFASASPRLAPSKRVERWLVRGDTWTSMTVGRWARAPSWGIRRDRSSACGRGERRSRKSVLRSAPPTPARSSFARFGRLGPGPSFPPARGSSHSPFLHEQAPRSARDWAISAPDTPRQAWGNSCHARSAVLSAR